MESETLTRTLPAIQHSIANHYDLKVHYDIRNFVCLDRNKVESITGKRENRREALIVHQFGEELEVTLFLDKDILSRQPYETQTPEWNSPDYDNYLTLLEGVSHFVYLVWNAEYGKCIKPVEMELQSDVDKFVMATTDHRNLDSITGNKPGSNAFMASLSDRLFSDFQISTAVNSSERRRYLIANKAARKYCRWLYNNYEFERNNRGLIAELARFYRMGASGKFKHISNLQ